MLNKVSVSIVEKILKLIKWLISQLPLLQN
jgi:hypothetical protein